MALSDEQRKAVLIAGGLGIVLIIALIWWAFSSGPSEIPIITNIGVDQGKNAVIGNLVANQEKNVNKLANTTNQAVNDVGNSINRDSSTFNGDGAGDRFCRDFPLDSSCQH